MSYNKMWYKSKTLWFNILAFVSVVLQVVFGSSILTAELQSTLIVVINVVLRAITKEQIEW